MKKTYIYYATEENAYETDKQVLTGDAKETIKQYLKDDYFDEEEAEDLASGIVESLEKNGFGYETVINGMDYGIVIGLAHHGKCHHITEEIKDCRRVMLEMF